jgi:DNA modification methylase
MLQSILMQPAVVIHYMENIIDLAILFHERPRKVVAWVYPSNTARQWRGIAWFGVRPDMTLGEQPYKNPNDKRIKHLIANGQSARLYDWWNVNQVKNVSKEKTAHPCQIPREVVRRILTVTPNVSIFDPFAGSGSTLLVAREMGRRAVGVEMDEAYCEIIANALSKKDNNCS